MNKSEILEFLNAHPACFLATVVGNKPHVRGVLMYRADEDGIIFHTGKMKDLHRELTENPQVELCFTNGKYDFQIRVSGAAELVEELELKKEIVEKRPFLKPWVAQSGYDPMAVYRVRKGRANVWSLAANFAAKEFIEL